MSVILFIINLMCTVAVYVFLTMAIQELAEKISVILDISFGMTSDIADLQTKTKDDRNMIYDQQIYSGNQEEHFKEIEAHIAQIESNIKKLQYYKGCDYMNNKLDIDEKQDFEEKLKELGSENALITVTHESYPDEAEAYNRLVQVGMDLSREKK